MCLGAPFLRGRKFDHGSTLQVKGYDRNPPGDSCQHLIHSEHAETGLTPVVVAITFVAVTTRLGPKPTAAELGEALLEHGGSVTQTAVALGVHRVTVHKWMREYGIEVKRVIETAA